LYRTGSISLFGFIVKAVIEKHNNSKKHDLKIHPEKIFENL
jgi:hypothetical protein